MNKKFLIINKLFLSMFVMAIFLGLGFVYAIDYPDYETSNECGQIPEQSTNSSNGFSYSTDSNIYQWYVNKESAIKWAVDDGAVCSDTTLQGGASRIDWKKNLCSSNSIDSLISYQEQLLESLGYNPQFNGKEQVRNTQDSLKNFGCQGHRDCKLGVVTIGDFLFCNLCDDINSNRKELMDFDPKECKTGYVLTDNELCCQPLPNTCESAIVTINGADNNKYLGEGEITIKLDFSSNDIGTLSFESNYVSVEGAEYDIQINDENNPTIINITLTPLSGYNEIYFEMLDGSVKLGENNCSAFIPTFYRDVECQERDKRNECTRGSTSPTEPDPLIDYSFLNGFDCEKSNGEIIDFCDCITPKVSSCEDYGTGRYEDVDGCCINCGGDKIYDSDKGDCVCDPNKECRKEGYIVDPVTCKCKCDPTKTCCGIELNTVVPFIGDCIEMTSQNNVGSSNDVNTSTVNQLNAFPFLMMGLSKIMVTVILIFSFLIIIVAGLMMVTGVAKESNFSKGKEWIQNVIIALILLGSSGLILRLINPNFFGG